MTTRTVQMIGYAYSETPTTVTVTYAGNTVFLGEIALNGTATPPMPDPLTPPCNILLSFEIPLTDEGAFPVTTTVNGGLVIFGPVIANYNNYPGNEYFPVGYMAGSVSGFAEIYLPGPDCRTNVIIDDVVQVREPGLIGDSSYTIQSGSTFTYDLNVTVGIVSTTP
jgi:hypothetical protein